MGLASMTRILLGLLFVSAGFVKTKRFGKEYTPDLWDAVNKELRKMDRALKDFPGRDAIRVNAGQAQEFFGYLDLTCGALLLMGLLTELATCLLMIEMLGLEYTLFIMEYPVQFQAFVIGVAVALLSTCTGGGRKEKYD